MFTKSLCIAAITAFACSLATAPANARARVFVASYGNDANPCTFGSPCKTFQQAVNVVDPGGEVTAIDSAGFGPITISRAVTITSPDGVEAGIVASAGADAIDINAGANDAVVLRGLTLDGGGVAYNGIVLNSGASLTVTNCVIQNFVYTGSGVTTGNGILMQPTSGTLDFTITNTTAVNNGFIGINYYLRGGAPNAKGVIDHVTTNANIDGMNVNTFMSSGGTTVVAISNSVTSNNSSVGIYVYGPATKVSIDNVSITGNDQGIVAFGPPVNVLLGRSVITGNNFGIVNGTSNTLYTYKDNRINLNGTDIAGNALNTTFLTQ
jgi:hypothetical protein